MTAASGTRVATAAKLALIAALLGACTQKAPAPAEPPTVIAALPTPEAAAGEQHYAGELRARYETALSFRVDGKLLARPAQLGEHVHAGQLLAQIDPGDSTATAAAASAALRAAQERLALARQQRDRNTAQLADALVSRAEAEQSDSAYAVAEAEVEQRRQELAVAQNQARYSQLLADHDGYITSENAEVGAVVKAGQPVLGLAWAGQSDAIIDVPESRIREFRRGRAARITLPASPGQVLDARVRDIAEVADPQSRTFRVKLALAHPQQALLGATADVAFDGARDARRLVIPASALFHDGTAPAVWVVAAADNTLALRRVQVAAYGPDTVTLASGLAADERVVVQGVHAVNAGERVSPVGPRAPSVAAGERP